MDDFILRTYFYAERRKRKTGRKWWREKTVSGTWKITGGKTWKMPKTQCPVYSVGTQRCILMGVIVGAEEYLNASRKAECFFDFLDILRKKKQKF